jgi:hypothetical protein
MAVCGQRPAGAQAPQGAITESPNITMAGRDTRRFGSADRQDLVACWDCAVRRSLMPPDLNHGMRWGLVYTVHKMCLCCTVRSAAFSWINGLAGSRPMASTIVNCTVKMARRATRILVADRHGLRASEVCDLQWHQVELDQGRTSAGPRTARHPFIRSGAMRFVRYASSAVKTRMSYAFVTERGGPMTGTYQTS